MNHNWEELTEEQEQWVKKQMHGIEIVPINGNKNRENKKSVSQSDCRGVGL